MTPDGEHTRQNLLRGVPLEIWCRSFQLRRSVTCIGRSQPADELGSVTNLMCLRTRSGSLSIRNLRCAGERHGARPAVGVWRLEDAGAPALLCRAQWDER